MKTSTLDFLKKNEKEIINQYLHKMIDIFPLPYDPEKLDEYIDIWWDEVADPGFELELDGLPDEYWDFNNETAQFEDECIEKALNILGLPREIME